MLEELFYPYAWKALLYQQEKGIYYVLLCTDSAAELNEESMYHQMERFQITFQKFFDCGVAIYYGALEDRQAVWELVRILKKADPFICQSRLHRLFRQHYHTGIQFHSH